MVDWALEMRFRKFDRFSLPAMVNFYQAHKERFIITGFNCVDPSILKGCQQIQTEMSILLAQYKRLPRPMKKLPQTSEDPRTRHFHESIAQLTRQLAEQQNGRCAYCGLPLPPDYETLDTVLPVALNHSKINVATKGSFYKLMTLIGNLRVACSRCNNIKGRAESRGVKRMQDLERMGYEVQLPLPLQFKKRGPRDFFNVSDHRNAPGVVIPRAEQHIALEQGCAVANQAALRVTMPCYHRPKWLLVSWNEETKHLTLGCSKCVDTTKIVWEIAVHEMQWRDGDANGKKHGLAEMLNQEDLPRKRVERQWVWKPWREMEKQMHLRSEYEIAFESQKRMHERFRFPPPPPLEVLKDRYEAHAAEADVEVMVPLEISGPDGMAEIARQLEREQEREHAGLKERLKGRLEDSWCHAE